MVAFEVIRTEKRNTLCFTKESIIVEENTVKNPFKNLLDMVSYLYHIYKENNQEEILCFANARIELPWNKYPKIASLDDMCEIIASMYVSSICPDEYDSWMTFDEKKLNLILQDEFFKEYHEIKHEQKRKYPFLEIYTYYKLQANIICSINDNDAIGLWCHWCYRDAMMEYIWPLRYYNIIADVYIAKGKNWFYNTADFFPSLGLDAVMYIWAVFGVVSCKVTGRVDDIKLKKDLSDLYSELLIACVRTDTEVKNKEIISYIQNVLMNFDNDKILELNKKLSSLQHENIALKHDKKTLEKTLDELRHQIKELDFDSDRTDTEKAEAIAKRIYIMMPDETGDKNKSTHEFAEIWAKLSKPTKEDINRSVRLFEEINAIDLSLFLMIRNVEREFDYNFFQPFHNSNEYKMAEGSICTNKNFRKTHDALALLKRHPTMGNIPFIGRAIKSKTGIESSEIIAGFSKFLGPVKEQFVEICASIEQYRIGVNKHKMVDVRNLFAHGNEANRGEYDKSSYDDLSMLLYDPPIRILFKIIKYSRKDNYNI